LFLFPYDKVKKDSNLIFYGAGDVGNQFAEELQKTQYCNIVCYIDKKYAEKIDFPHKVFPPEVLLEINETSYDNILVCVNNDIFWEEIKTKLLSLNVKSNKILFEKFKQIRTMHEQKTEYETNNGTKPDILRIALISICGFGDLLIVIFFALHLRKLLYKCNIVIDIHTRQNYINAINTIPYIDNCYSFKTYIQAEYYNYDTISNNYDIILGFEILAGVLKINLGKVHEFSPIFCDYLENLIKQHKLICPWLGRTFLSYLRAKTCAEFFGKNMLEQFNLQDILPYNRNSATYFEFAEQDFKILQKNKLEYKRYITICVTANIAYKNCVKTWPLSYYRTLIDLIKAKYPYITIVQIGDSEDMLDNTDINLLNKTNLSEACVLLKNALVHIGNEGGLIHLTYFLNNTCVLLAGSVAGDFYYYETNINIRSDFAVKECKKDCVWIAEEWPFICIKNLSSIPKCMEMLYPELVFEKISEYIDNLPDYSYKTERMFEFNCENDLNSILDTIIEQRKHLNISLIYHKYYNTVLSSLEKANCNITIYGRSLLEIEQKFANSEYGFIYNIPAKDNTFDITLNFSMPDLKYPQFALNEALRVTKENGIVLIQQDKSLSVIKKEKQNAR